VRCGNQNKMDKTKTDDTRKHIPWRYPYGPVNLSIRSWKNIHTALSYEPVRLFNNSVTNWMFLYWPWYRFSVSSIDPRGSGSILLTSNLYQGQYRNNQLVILYYKHNIVFCYDICFFPLLFPTNRSISKEILYWIHSFIATTGFNIWKCQFGFKNKIYFTQDLTWLNHDNIGSFIIISRGTILFYDNNYNIYIHFVNCVFFLQNPALVFQL
jgi:hypothetical protein